MFTIRPTTLRTTARHALALGAGVAFFAGFAAVGHAADIYKWVDARGVVNYSDEAPPDQQARKMDRSMYKLIVIPASPAASEKSRRVADDLARARLDAQAREQNEARFQSQVPMESQHEALIRAWREKCIADRWADCDNTAVLHHRYGYFPYGVPLAGVHIPIAPTAVQPPRPPRLERTIPVTPATPERPANPPRRPTDR